PSRPVDPQPGQPDGAEARAGAGDAPARSRWGRDHAEVDQAFSLTRTYVRTIMRTYVRSGAVGGCDGGGHMGDRRPFVERGGERGICPMRGTGGPHTLPGMGTDVKQRVCGSSRRRMFVGTTVAGSEEAAAPFPAEIALVWALLAVVAVPVALMAIPIAVLVG